MKLTPIKETFIGDVFRHKGDRAKYFLNSVKRNDSHDRDTWLYEARLVTDKSHVVHLFGDHEIYALKERLGGGGAGR